MTKTIVVTSGKGGVGKTTTSASIATGLAKRGYKTVVIDFDVGLRNLDLIMGCERRVVYDLVNLVNQEAVADFLENPVIPEAVADFPENPVIPEAVADFLVSLDNLVVDN